MTRPRRHGPRPAYGGLPVAVRAWVDGVLGARVTRAVGQPGGVLTGCRGTAARRGRSPGLREAVNAAHDPRSGALPGTAPAPRLLSSYDDGAWVALAFADVGGRGPAVPWRANELDRVVSVLDKKASDTTPCPLAEVDDVTTGNDDPFSYRRDAAAGPPHRLDGWALRHLDRLAEVEARWKEAAAGDTLLHLDVRADNLLLADERVWLVDWPSAARGAAVRDLVAFAPSVAMQGGPAPDDLLAALSAVGRSADPDVVTVLTVIMAGYLAVGALAPPPPGLPTVRAFQAAQGATALRRVARRTGW